ncbi:MAG: DPP IV N-terminal domain-containing protein [Bacteroidota bacterium]
MKRTFLLLLLFSPFWSYSQQLISMADAISKGRTSLAPSSLRQLQWIPDSDNFSHVTADKVVIFSARDIKSDTLNLLPAINEKLAAQGAGKLDRIPAFTWTAPDKFWFQNESAIYSWDIREGSLKRLNWFPQNASGTDIHDKSFFTAYLKDNGLWVSIGGKELGVAQSEENGIVYGQSVHRDEFGISKGTFWSTTGRYLAFYRMDERMVTKYPVYVLDSMPAQVNEIRYPFAGAKSHHVTVGIYDTQSGRKWYLNTLPEGGDPEQYLTNIAWTPDDRYVMIAVVNRSQSLMKLNLYDATSGAFVRTLFEESSDKWVEPEKPAVFMPGNNSQFIWQSERDGYNHLYLCDLSGKIIRQISRGSGPVTAFYGFDTKGEKCFFQMADSTGLNRLVCSSEIRNGKMSVQDTEPGTHNGLISSNGEWALDVYSDLDTPREVFLSRWSDNRKKTSVFSAANPLSAYKIGLTSFVSIPSPGGFRLNARIILPPDMDPATKYPAIIYVYNGPHVQMVTNSWLGGGELWMHHMAQNGYIVFALDGRGSANRGFAFESAVHRRLADGEMEDQLAGVNYLKSLGYVDPERIGVYGWSYGGFMTTSLMTRPEAKGAFRCGIAGGPVLDWRMYEIMYTERYMDTPDENPEGYRKSSLFNYIENLNAPLLMIHGSSDNVVLWQHSLRYIRECVRKNKQISYFVYPEHLHNVTCK